MPYVFTPESKRRQRIGQALGGYNRVAKMTPKQLSASARKAVQARWARLTPEERSAWRNARDANAAARRRDQKS